MKKPDATKMLAQRYSPNIISFSNINQAADVWWLDISLNKLRDGIHDFLVLALCNQKQQLEVIEVPTAFLRENLQNLYVREDKNCLSLELSCKKQNLFECVRPTNCGISFAEFRVDTIET